MCLRLAHGKDPGFAVCFQLAHGKELTAANGVRILPSAPCWHTAKSAFTVCFIFAVCFSSAHGKCVDFTVCSSVQHTAKDVNAEC